jgi:plastocyanin
MTEFGLRTALKSTVLLGASLFLFFAAFPPFDDLAEVDLTLHMLQHVLIMIAGVLVAYPVFKGRAMVPRRWAAWASLSAASGLIVFWHLPGPWDSAVLSPAVHAVEHLSFFGVGLLIGSWTLHLSDSAKIGALLAAFFGHMGYALALIVPWTGQVYGVYSVADQSIAGWTLLLTGPSLMAGVAYVVARNPKWLGGFTGGGSSEERRETFIDRLEVPSWAASALTGTLALVAVAYVCITAVALAGGSGVNAPGVSPVQIAETPVSWQYSPQQIHVVLGVNNTVTWSSHSISYDSVTSRTGAFDSGPIPPGGSYTFTFESPGTYDYYCVYHPWMTGVVVVTKT